MNKQTWKTIEPKIQGNSVLKKSIQVIIPATQQLTGILGIFPLSESDICTSCQTFLISDKRARAVREIVRWLCLIMMAKEKGFYISAMTLKSDSALFDAMYENSYFYDKALIQACQYLIPEATGSGLFELLNALVMWKQNLSFQRFPALAVVLMLYLLKRLVIIDQRLCHHQCILLQILIYSPPENLVEKFIWQLNDIISKINLEEEHEDK